jgi:hypothetical protein
MLTERMLLRSDVMLAQQVASVFTTHLWDVRSGAEVRNVAPHVNTNAIAVHCGQITALGDLLSVQVLCCTHRRKRNVRSCNATCGKSFYKQQHKPAVKEGRFLGAASAESAIVQQAKTLARAQERRSTLKI